MTDILVSVVIGTYRRDVDLKKALQSLEEQSYTMFEIIVVDDNDECEWNSKVQDIVNIFISKNPQIPVKYIQNHPNQGSGKTRNIGIAASEGEFICFLDDDDLYLPNRIANQLFPMREFGVDYSITDLALYSESDKLIEVRKRDYINDYSKESLLKYHLMYHMTGTDTLMFKKNYLNEIKGFPSVDVGDEFYLMQKAIEQRGKFLYVPVCDVKAYVHTGENGLSSGISKIDGENNLFEHKKSFFSQLDRTTIRYIKMRHYAVLAFAYLRLKNYGKFLVNALRSFFIAPTKSFWLLISR